MINRGEFDRAETSAERMLAVAEATFGTDDPAIVPGLTTLGMIFQQTGRLADAERVLRRALEIARRPDAGEGTLAEVLNRLGNVLSDDGRLKEAEATIREAIEIGGRLQGPSMLAISLNNLGHILTALRRFEEADAVYRRAVDLVGDDAVVAAAMPANLAVQLMGQKRYEEAERLLLKSVAAWDAMKDPVVVAQATALLNLGRLYYETGRRDEASATFARVTGLLDQGFPANHPLRAYLLQNLSQIAFDGFDLPEAERRAREAVAVAEEALPPSKFEVADQYEALAQATLLQGKWDEAIHAARRAVEILSADVNKGKADKDDWDLLSLVEIVASEGIQAADPVNAMTKVVEARRSAFINLQRHAATDTGGVLAAAAARAEVGGEELAALVREKDGVLEKLRGVEAAFVSVSAGVSEPASRQASLRDLRSQSERLRERLDAIDAKLLADFPRYVDLAGAQPVPAERVIAMLAEDEILLLPVIMESSVMTFAYGRGGGLYAWGRSPADAAELPRLAAALLCQASRNMNPACAGATLDRGREAGQPGEARGVVAFKSPATGDIYDLDAAHRAYSLLIPPDLRELIAGKRLIIAPSPELLGFPWHLLVTRPPAQGWAGGGNDIAAAYRNAAWLFREHPSITVVPGLAGLDGARRSPPTAATGARRYLGVADPEIGRTDAEREADPAPCRPSPSAPTLLAAARSAAVVGPLFADVSGEAAGLADVAAVRRQPRLDDSRCEVEATAATVSAEGAATLLLGADATEARIKAMDASGDLRTYGILHFATHGLVGGEFGQAEPGLLLTPPASASESDDGVLTAREIAALDLDAEWVILSACNTAAGSRSDAEALAGLARSFFYAGARSLLVSAWPVYSQAATRFTTSVFATLAAQPGSTRGEAVVVAMRQMLAESTSPETAHPAYWAPFLLVGDAGR